MTDTETRLGGAMVAVGSLVVVVITVLYATLPPIVSAPLPPDTPMADALTAAGPAAGRLVLAGRFGIFGDLLLILGAGLLAARTTERPLKRLLWNALALSTGIFLLLDGLAGFVLAPLLDDPSGFGVARRVFDLAFFAGTGAFGLGAVAGLMTDTWPRWLRGMWGVVAAFGLGTTLLALFGVVVPIGLGAAVGFAGLASALTGWREMRAARP